MKQHKIINAAFKEFAEQGYKKASTNNIVKMAEISKGILFYYFNNKLELYHDLINYGLQVIKEKYLHLFDDSHPDIIDKYRQYSMIKMKAFQDDPYLFQFFTRVYLELNEEHCPDGLNKEIEEMRDNTITKLTSNIDTSKFRNDIPPEKVMSLIKWCMFGYEQELVEKFKNTALENIDYKYLWDEYYDFLNILRKTLYHT